MFRDCQVLQLQLSFESISGGTRSTSAKRLAEVRSVRSLVVGAAGAKADDGSDFVAGFA